MPKLALPVITPSPGLPKFAWLKMSKKSALKTRREDSLILVPFEIEKSVLLNPGPVMALRPRLPKWNTPDGLTGTAHDFSGSPEDYNKRVFLEALRVGYFTTWRKSETIGRGDRREFATFVEATTNAEDDPRALVYAVIPSGSAVCLVRSEWPQYRAMIVEQANAKAKS